MELLSEILLECYALWKRYIISCVINNHMQQKPND